MEMYSELQCSKVHSVQDSVLQYDQCLAVSALFTIFSCSSTMYLGVVYVITAIVFSYLFFSFDAAWGQLGANPHFCPRTHSSQTNHRLRSEILQKFPWGNVRIYSFSR